VRNSDDEIHVAMNQVLGFVYQCPAECKFGILIIENSQRVF